MLRTLTLEGTEVLGPESYEQTDRWTDVPGRTVGGSVGGGKRRGRTSDFILFFFGFVT